MIGIDIILQVLLTFGGFVFRFLGASDKQMKWLSESADTLREKGWIRKNFILELEKDRSKHLDEELDKPDQDAK